MRGYLYILRCRDGSYYVGSTTNPDYRVQQHKDGEGGDYTQRRLPVELVYAEEFESIHEAFLAEREVECWRREKKDALIRLDYEALPELSWNSLKRAEVMETRRLSQLETSSDNATPVLRQAQDAMSNALSENRNV